MGAGPWVPSLENWGGGLKSLLWLANSPHTHEHAHMKVYITVLVGVDSPICRGSASGLGFPAVGGRGGVVEGCGDGDTSILATSSTILLDAMCTRALEELQLELDPSMGPELEEEEEEEVVLAREPREADGLLRF